MVTLYGTLAPSDQQTLRLAPLWMFSALVGRTRLETWELDAIWDAVRATLPTTTQLGSEALQATLDDPDIVAAYERTVAPSPPACSRRRRCRPGSALVPRAR